MWGLVLRRVRGLQACSPSMPRHFQRPRRGPEGGRGRGGRRGSRGDQEQQSEGQSERKSQKGWDPEGKGAEAPSGSRGLGLGD